MTICPADVAVAVHQTLSVNVEDCSRSVNSANHRTQLEALEEELSMTIQNPRAMLPCKMTSLGQQGQDSGKTAGEEIHLRAWPRPITVVAQVRPKITIRS